MKISHPIPINSITSLTIRGTYDDTMWLRMEAYKNYEGVIRGHLFFKHPKTIEFLFKDLKDEVGQNGASETALNQVTKNMLTRWMENNGRDAYANREIPSITSRLDVRPGVNHITK